MEKNNVTMIAVKPGIVISKISLSAMKTMPNRKETTDTNAPRIAAKRRGTIV